MEALNGMSCSYVENSVLQHCFFPGYTQVNEVLLISSLKYPTDFLLQFGHK